MTGLDHFERYHLKSLRGKLAAQAVAEECREESS